ncbi:MAG: hypothetical protein LBF89_12780, partial [Bacteroidales bacterium]|nr:hypothetical protein [Bacteroidales bacterium]
GEIQEESDEQANSKQAHQRHENYAKLRSLSETMQKNKETAQEIIDVIPFVGAAFEMSEGAINNDDAAFATGLGMLVVDMAGGGILKGAGKAVTKGVTVLGKYPDYINLASEIGAKRFNISTNIWNKMTAADQWIANVKFLDRAIERGDIIVLSNRVTNISNVTGSFRRELDYLISKGYKLSSSGLQMIK